MDKQELIDKAVNELKGTWPEDEDNSYLLICKQRVKHYLKGDYSSGPSARPHQYYWDVICKKEQFTQRAKELGWINGYQYSVEYETNGKIPDLPFDIIVEVNYKKLPPWQRERVSDALWHSTYYEPIAFRIIDERYKPKEVSTNTLQKGTLVQFPSGQGVMVLSDPDSNGVVIVQDDRGEYRRVSAENIKPIKTEREKFMDVICKHLIYKDAVGKPKDHSAQPRDMVDNSWHERGEHPPVGTECEFSCRGHHDGFQWCIFRGLMSDGGFIVEYHHHTSPDRVTCTPFDPAVTEFRPIKSER